MPECVVGSEVAPGFAHDVADLELVVELLGNARIRHFLVVAVDCRVIALEEPGTLIYLTNGLVVHHVLEVVLNVSAEGETVANDGRIDRGAPGDITNRDRGVVGRGQRLVGPSEECVAC